MQFPKRILVVDRGLHSPQGGLSPPGGFEVLRGIGALLAFSIA